MATIWKSRGTLGGGSKAALDYYSRTLAVELAPSGIRVDVVSPRVISTPGPDEFAKTTPGFSPDDCLRYIPLGRIGATEEITEVVALLAASRLCMMRMGSE